MLYNRIIFIMGNLIFKIFYYFKKIGIKLFLKFQTIDYQNNNKNIVKILKTLYNLWYRLQFYLPIILLTII